MPPVKQTGGIRLILFIFLRGELVTVQTAYLLDSKSRSRSIGYPSDAKISAKTVL